MTVNCILYSYGSSGDSNEMGETPMGEAAKAFLLSESQDTIFSARRRMNAESAKPTLLRKRCGFEEIARPLFGQADWGNLQIVLRILSYAKYRFQQVLKGGSFYFSLYYIQINSDITPFLAGL